MTIVDLSRYSKQELEQIRREVDQHLLNRPERRRVSFTLNTYAHRFATMSDEEVCAQLVLALEDAIDGELSLCDDERVSDFDISLMDG